MSSKKEGRYGSDVDDGRGDADEDAIESMVLGQILVMTEIEDQTDSQWELSNPHTLPGLDPSLRLGTRHTRGSEPVEILDTTQRHNQNSVKISLIWSQKRQ